MIFAKYAFLVVVTVSVILLIRFAIRSLERKVALCFKVGFANHYTVIKRKGNERQTEFLAFPFKQLEFSSVLFLFVCWFVRIVEPNTTLFDLRFPTRASQRENDAENICSIGEIRPIDLHFNDDLRNGGLLSDGRCNKPSYVFNNAP